MRKIVFIANADTVGTDYAELHEFQDDITDKELDGIAEKIGYYNAQRYEPSWDEDSEFDNPEDFYDDYIECCDWWWEEYNPDIHDRLL